MVGKGPWKEPRDAHQLPHRDPRRRGDAAPSGAAGAPAADRRARADAASAQARHGHQPAALRGVGRHSPRQVARWWALYRRDGLAGLLREPTYPGKTPRLTAAALADLQTVMATGQ